MKGNGNGFDTLFRKLYFMLLPTCGQRTRYINKHKKLFKHVGEQLFFQSRNFPSDPELISFGNNVMIASNVSFINHDVISYLFNKKYKTLDFKPLSGAIQIGDNVMIGAQSIILPDVKIGNNVVIAAGSIITKDIPDNCVAGGVPAKVIGNFDDLVEKRRNLKLTASDAPELLWNEFFEKRKSK